MNVLHYAPGACSLAVHVVLEEIGQPFERRRWDLSRGENESPEFTALNPLQRVPVLETATGTLTEAAAILQWLAREHPEAAILPDDARLVRVQEWLNFLGAAVHPAFAPMFRPQRFADDDAAQKVVVARCRARASALLDHAAVRFGAGPWALGDTFSIVDPYLFVFLRWARRLEFDATSWKELVPFFDRMHARPSVRRAMDAEGLGA